MIEKTSLIQEQKQEQKLTQSFSQQQLLHAQLVELPITQLLERINTEMNDNPALEVETDNPEYAEPAEYTDYTDAPEDYDAQREREDRQSALDEALASIGRDDEDLPVYNHSTRHYGIPHWLAR